MLGISAVITLIKIITVTLEIGLLNDVQAGIDVDFSRLELNDNIRSVVAFFYLGTLVLTAYAFIAWMHRAYLNLERAGMVFSKH